MNLTLAVWQLPGNPDDPGLTLHGVSASELELARRAFEAGPKLVQPPIELDVQARPNSRIQTPQFFSANPTYRWPVQYTTYGRFNLFGSLLYVARYPDGKTYVALSNQSTRKAEPTLIRLAGEHGTELPLGRISEGGGYRIATAPNDDQYYVRSYGAYPPLAEAGVTYWMNSTALKWSQGGNFADILNGRILTPRSRYAPWGERTPLQPLDEPITLGQLPPPQPALPGIPEPTYDPPEQPLIAQDESEGGGGALALGAAALAAYFLTK